MVRFLSISDYGFSYCTQGDVERKLSQMILDKKFHGIPKMALFHTHPLFGLFMRLSWRLHVKSMVECSLTMVCLCTCRHSGPRWGGSYHIWRTSSGQDLRGRLGNHSEHEQSGWFTLQQSKEADIGENHQRKKRSLVLLHIYTPGHRRWVSPVYQNTWVVNFNIFVWSF